MGLKRLGVEPVKKKKFVHPKRVRVFEPEEMDQTHVAPTIVETQTKLPPSSPLQAQSQSHRLAPNEDSPGNHTFDINVPYDRNIPTIDESIFS